MDYSDSNTTQATSQENTGVIDKVTGFFSGLLKGKSSNTTTNGQYQSNTDNNTQYGGAGSRRRKCNKKHHHTKSCRKYVKKGRKTRKH